MTKIWRLLMATTVLSGLTGIGMAAAANEHAAVPNPDEARPASVLLAQAQPTDEERRRQQQQRQDQRQERRQDRQQGQQGQQQEQRGQQGQQQQQRGQQQEQRQQRGQQEQQQQRGRQDRQDQRREQGQQQDQRGRQDQQQQRGQGQQQERRQDQRPATASPPPPPPPSAPRQGAQPDTRQQGQQGQPGQQDRRTTSPASPPPPPPPAAGPATSQPPGAAPGAGQTRDQRRDRDQPAAAPGGQPQQQTPAVQGGAQQDRRTAPLTRAGTPAPETNARPIPSQGAGKGVAVQSSSGQEIRSVDQLRSERREVKEGNRTIIREPDRTIIKEGNRTIIRHDEADRFRLGARDVRVERVGNESRTVIIRPGGERIVTVTDRNGYLLRRVRVLPDGREIIIIDNRPRPGVVFGNFFVVLPPPVIRIPRERYIVAYGAAPPALIYDTLVAPPVDRIERAYTLDEIRYSPSVRDRMPRIDLNTVNFQSGSWDLTPDQIDKLGPIADSMKRAIDQNPQTVFLIEGHTDAVGSEEDNLSLSDRRAESVAVALTEQFQVPPENLSTQGYGEQQPIEQTSGPSEVNRRVSVRNITPLLVGQNDQGQPRQQPN